jgi:hypothetical protein
MNINVKKNMWYIYYKNEKGKKRVFDKLRKLYIAILKSFFIISHSIMNWCYKRIVKRRFNFGTNSDIGVTYCFWNIKNF